MFEEQDSPIPRLIAEIEAAFNGVSREEGVTLHETYVIDSGGNERWRAKARRKDTEMRWLDVPDEEIEKASAALCFLDAKGFRYYIPAYMVWTLRNYRTTSSLSADNTIYAFSHKTVDNDGRFELLDAAQRRAICRFLRHFTRSDPDEFIAYYAEVALQYGWATYCE
jgi:hypothetical protein